MCENQTHQSDEQIAELKDKVGFLEEKIRKIRALLDISEWQKHGLKKERDELLEKVRNNFIG